MLKFKVYNHNNNYDVITVTPNSIGNPRPLLCKLSDHGPPCWTFLGFMIISCITSTLICFLALSNGRRSHLSLVRNIWPFPGSLNGFDILEARKTSDPAPLRKLEIHRLQMEAAFLHYWVSRIDIYKFYCLWIKNTHGFIRSFNTTDKCLCLHGYKAILTRPWNFGTCMIVSKQVKNDVGVMKYMRIESPT